MSTTPAGNHKAQRTHIAVSLSVWKALFLREAVARISAQRAGWVWLVLEPMLHIAMITYVITGFKGRDFGDTDAALFVALGLIGFRFFSNPAFKSPATLGTNRALLVYRQVKPIDPILSRCVLEGWVQILVAVLFMCMLSLLNHDVLPVAPLTPFLCVLTLWLFGLGTGLVLSAATVLGPEVGRFTNLLGMPMYFLSGVLFSPSQLPPAMRDVVLLNPVAHGIELLRSGFFPGYYVADQVSFSYLLGFTLVYLFFGLALHRHLQTRLISL